MPFGYDTIKSVMIVALSLTALAPITSVHAQPLSIEDARHLIQRTGFAEPPSHIIEATHQTKDELITQILGNSQPLSIQAEPDWFNAPVRIRPDYRDLTEQERREKNQAINKLEKRRARELQYWWLSSLITTPNPLQAKMTLFWQNHFTSSQRKVRHAQLMVNQLELIQTEATGNFASLLKGMLQDPAMLIYLDNRSNRKKKPNENLARELLELFTLGEGHYSEQDIKEAARALTGYAVNQKFEFVFRRKQHDDGIKTILGHTAKHDAMTLADRLLEHPATAKNIVEKLWRYFVSPEGPTEEIERLAAVLRKHDYEIKPLLAELFRSPVFWDANNRATLIRSPADFIASTLRASQIPTVDQRVLLRATREMGQILFHPPNVKGWQTGHYWINGQTLLARNSFAVMVARNPGKLKKANAKRQMADSSGTANNMMRESMENKNDMSASNQSEMVHLVDAPDSLSDNEVRTALISTSIPVNGASVKKGSRIGRFIQDPAWNLY